MTGVAAATPLSPLEEVDDTDLPTKRKGWGIATYVAAGWLILIVLAAILAPVLPLGDPAARVARRSGAGTVPARRAHPRHRRQRRRHAGEVIFRAGCRCSSRSPR
ncbi:MAG: hypothetical protein R2701_06535 [Acidimicrobiales bacterium]